MHKSETNSANKWLQKQRHVWVKALSQYPNPNQDAFLQGKVLQINEKQINIQLIDAQSKIKAPIQNVLKLTYGPSDVADMVDLQQLNQPQLLFNIKRRYINDLIFTYCGPTLVIVNPYAYIQKLFNDSNLLQYQTMVFTDNLQYKSMPPHVFSLAAFCLWQLFDNQRNQSIVISGESGAGKTQNTKYCLKFLASLGKNMALLVNDLNKQQQTKNNKKINYQNLRNVQKTIKRTNSSKIFGIQQKILGCNQILQAFGNSKTIRNDNSSRFGKLILLVYGQTQIDIKSAFIISYLLQKSRIVSVSDGERNYHIFYYFCKGTTIQEKQQYRLNDAINKYYYLNQSTTYDLPKGSDQQKFKEIKKQFSLYLVQEQTDCVYRVLSIVLNIGNLLFKKGQNKNNQQIATIVNQQYIKNVTELLQVDYQLFKHSFQYKTRKTGGSVINSPLKYDQALALRDSFAKNIYEKVFNYLVSKLNQKIQIQKIDFQGTQSRQKRKSIGLLDIFGFQVLLLNSLQQFFINFANQKLQQLYVSYIFKQQQTQFRRQGLEQFSHDIGFQDNKPIIDLFQLYPSGIFYLINQSSQLNQTDQVLAGLIQKKYVSPFISIPKSKRNHFQINHSCSPVSYNTNGFTGKNKDQFPRQLLDVIKTTKNQFMKKIVVGQQKQEQSKTKKASSKFLGSKFLSQMNKLIEQLYSCDCHFVRCIKPNSKKSPKLFNSEAVLQSLRYLGVLDSIRIRKLGYIYRRPYKQFHKKFYELERYIYSYHKDIQGKHEDDFKDQCKRVLQKFAKKQLQNKDILFGSKKILIKQSALNHLQLLAKQKRKLRIQTATRIKLMYKNAVFRVQVKTFFLRIKLLKDNLHKVIKQVRVNIVNKKVLRVQNVIRKYLWHLRLQKIKQQATKSVTKISAYLKMKRQRKQYLKIRKNIVSIQANIRCFLLMNKFFKQKMCMAILKTVFNASWDTIRVNKAIIIQKNWRGYKIRKQFQQVMKRMKVRAFIKRAVLKFRVKSIKQMLQMYKRPIIMLQAIVRGRYCRRTYQNLKKSTLIIQKTYRRHLHKRFYLQKIWKQQRQVLQILEKQKQKQLNKIGLTIKSIPNFKVNLYQTSALVQKLSPIQLKTHFNPQLSDQVREMKVNQSVSFSDKNTMQLYIGDVDILSTLTYKGNWATKYSNLKAQLAKKQQYILKIQLNQSFTTLITNKDRVYTFGKYIEGQQRQNKYQNLNIKIQVKSSINNLICNNDDIYVITKDNQLYKWSNNNINRRVQNEQKNMKFIQQKTINNIKDIQIKQNSKYYVNDQGKLYIKQKQDNYDNSNKTKLISLGAKIFINYIASSYDFIHFVTNFGQIFSMGSNKLGQLGLDTLVRIINEPILNQYFTNKKQIIQTVSVGLSHTVVRTKLGYVYSWGDNRSGQVSLQPISIIRRPIQLQYEKQKQKEKQKLKVLQAIAGLRTTYLLLQNLNISALGTSSSFDTTKLQNYFSLQLLNITHSNYKNLIPINLSTTWNRQMSILTINCIQNNKCKTNTKSQVILKYCKIMSKQWKIKQIYPQYSQWMDNILNISDMRKFKFSNNTNNNTVNNSKVRVNTKNNNQSDLEQLKVLMDLRKTSTLFKNAARNKIQDLIKKLGSKKQEEWTKQDQEINIYIKQYCKVVQR